jgi:hypothetical protein
MKAASIAIVAFACACAPTGGGSACGPVSAGTDGGQEPEAGARDASLDALEASATDDVSDAPISDAPPEGATLEPPGTFLRLANWSPDAPAVDFCVAPHGSGTFVGPLVAALASSEDGGSSGLTYPQVSAYSVVASGPFDVRVVVSGSESCGVGIGPDTTNLSPLAVGSSATVALIGDEAPSGGEPGLRVVSFSDDRASTTPLLQVRFINAAPSVGEADLLESTATSTTSPPPRASFVTLFEGVAFGTVGGQEGVEADAGGDAAAFDSNGYQVIAPEAQVVLGARATGVSGTAKDLVDTPTISELAGNVMTVVLLGRSGSPTTQSLLECADNAGVDAPLSDCFLLTP